MKTKFSKLFVTILIVAAVTCCGALGVFAADDANADTTAATTASEVWSLPLWLRVLPVSAAAWPSLPLRLPLSQPTARTKRPSARA